jgi:hypothetical protein
VGNKSHFYAFAKWLLPASVVCTNALFTRSNWKSKRLVFRETHTQIFKYLTGHETPKLQNNFDRFALFWMPSLFFSIKTPKLETTLFHQREWLYVCVSFNCVLSPIILECVEQKAVSSFVVCSHSVEQQQPSDSEWTLSQQHKRIIFVVFFRHTDIEISVIFKDEHPNES